MRQIKGFENYTINEQGEIFTRKGFKRKPCTDKDGYLYVRIERSRLSIHRLIAIAFIPNPDSKPHINHINGIRADNAITNLEWCTQQENVIDGYRRGRKPAQGEKFPQHKLTEAQVLEIKSLPKYSVTLATLAAKYNVCITTIRNVITSKKWKHIKIK